MASKREEINNLQGKIRLLALSVLLFELAMWYVTNEQDRKLMTLDVRMDTHVLTHQRIAEAEAEAESKKDTK